MNNSNYERAEDLRIQGIDAANKGDITGAIKLFDEGISIYPYDKLYYFRALTRLIDFKSQGVYLVSNATYALDDLLVYTLFQWLGYVKDVNRESAEDFYKYMENLFISVNECFKIVDPKSLDTHEPGFDELMRRDFLYRRGLKIGEDRTVIKQYDVEDLNDLFNYLIDTFNSDFDNYLNSGIKDDVKQIYTNISHSRECFIDLLKFFMPRYYGAREAALSGNDQSLNIKEVMRDGDKYYRNKDFIKALEMYQGILRVDGKNEEALVKEGLCFYMLGKNNNARVSFENALKVNPNNRVVQGYLNLL